MPVFASVELLKKAIRACDPSEFFVNFLLSQQAESFMAEKIDFVASSLSKEFQVAVGPEELTVVGSAKLGYALHEKRQNGQVIAPAFRPFGDESDVDLSICSPRLFTLLWREVSAYACGQKIMPIDHGKFGDYLAYGWMRSDKMPFDIRRRLILLGRIAEVRGRIRRDRARGHAKVDFGIFYDLEHLKLYQVRSISHCRSSLEAPL